MGHRSPPLVITQIEVDRSFHRLAAYVCNRTDQGMKFVHGGKGKFRSVVVPFPPEGWT